MSESILRFIQQNIPPWVFILIVVHFVVLGTVAYLILLERKVASWVQDRIGPNRVGLGFGLPFLPQFHFWGLGQPLADGIKFIVKEDYRPRGVDRILFTMAPAIMIIVIIISIAVIPWGGVKQSVTRMKLTAPAAELAAEAQTHLPSGTMVYGQPREVLGQVGQFDVTYRYRFQIASLNIGVLYILATLSLAVYGVVIGGWASNNKYSFLGGLRATVNMISYEIPLGLAVLAIVILFGTLDLETIVELQAHWWQWNVFSQPLAFLLFLTCIHAEANRAPFDLAECEQELVGGYHTEYSAMRFALFFLAEYAGMITTSCVCVALFFGGWHFPFITVGHADPNNAAVTDSLGVCILRGVVFFVKAIVVLFVFMWVRWSLPRFRFDQLMQIAWRGLIPISLGLLMANVLVVYFTGASTLNGLTHNDVWLLLGMNVGVLILSMILAALLPAPPDTNRKVPVIGSRYAETHLPGAPSASVI
jgi:NADH-quinone oxidoreductase subunit H